MECNPIIDYFYEYYLCILVDWLQSSYDTVFFLLLYHLYFFMIYCQEIDYFMYDPIVYTCFYVKRWRKVWFGAI